MKLGVASVKRALPMLVALAAAACGVSGPAPAEDDTQSPSAGPGSGAGGAANGSGNGSQNGSGSASGGSNGSGAGLPTANVEWFDWVTQQPRTGSAWGSALTDIATHLPAQYGTTYDDPDLVTFGHETSHGIHAHLRNYENTTGQAANAFYVLDDKAALVIEPNILKHEVAPYVPASLRDFRYGTYITGQSAWDDTPLYIWDEWNAYVNGAHVGVVRVEEGLWGNDGWRDQSGNLEFVVYAMATAHAVSELDPDYFQSYEQFRAFLQWNTERAMALFYKHQAMPEFESQDIAAYHEAFKTESDADALRQFIRATFGQDWTTATLGF